MAAPGDNIEELERAYELETSANAAADLDLLDRAIFHVNHGAARITGHQANQDHQKVRTFLLSRGWNTVWLARKALSTGYVPQALLLARAALEDWATAHYVRNNPNEAPRYLHTPQPPTAKGQTPKFPKIFADLHAQYGDTPRLVYEELSLFAHPRAFGLRFGFTLDDTGFHMHAGPPPQWDRSSFELGLYYLLQLVQMFYKAVALLWEDVTGYRPWVDEARALTNQIVERLQAQDTTWKEAKQAAQQEEAEAQ